MLSVAPQSQQGNLHTQFATTKKTRIYTTANTNLQNLHERLRRGAYRAKPSRRVYIPKADGRQRPLGIASLEDKLVQRAVVEVMNAIYEVDFLGFSYGFRPNRSQHDALDALAYGIQTKKVNWVLDADIRGFFDALKHEWLMKFLGHRVADKRLLRLIQKWLAAGVLEHGSWTASEQGSPQGATVSPLLANIYLHYVFDLWVHQWRKRHATGNVIVVRYADDFVVGFQKWEDAQRFYADLSARVQKFGLELHPEKTRVIEFGRFADQRRREVGKGRPETFKFLGFTHICGKSKTNGFLLLRHTIPERMTAKLAEVKAELQTRRHHSIPEQGKWLGSVLRGYYAYHAVPTNVHALQAFLTQVERHWLKALRRRGQRDRTNWARMRILSKRWLPTPKILHPWPNRGSTPEPEVGAQCVSSARWDLCGGRGVTRVPTATAYTLVTVYQRNRGNPLNADSAVNCDYKAVERSHKHTIKIK
jgi:group II intron reverse transcriptase/maturase